MKLKTTAADYAVIAKIAERAEKFAAAFLVHYPRTDILMDLDATHSNGTPLKFEELLKAPDTDFVHDVFGIRKHINRKTGVLEGFFHPRYSA